jgi:hypothetical protein
MPSPGMLRRVTRVSSEVSEERSASTPILVTLMLEVLRSSETSVLTRVTRRNIPEDGLLHSLKQTQQPSRPNAANSGQNMEPPWANPER